MILNTLKDLEVEDMSDLVVMSHKLREEAIKEILLLKREGEKQHDVGLYRFGRMLLNDSPNHKDFFLMVNYIKWKFDITDEQIEDANCTKDDEVKNG